ncbi:MAG: type II toxin-antitoxin system HicB family antitoxin [Chloroflexi bacterium]|nr:type II toxin-antitoxin system HicB family antitoxin [Chloroflexota bacterium]MDL1941299.1 type II toxin-antitoxin system HicB family antitoxin [Chloroflexi bacterium CFX2]
MDALSYRVLLRKEPEGGFTISVPSLPGCVTFGETLEESVSTAREAIELYIESPLKHGEKDVFKYTLVSRLDAPAGD